MRNFTIFFVVLITLLCIVPADAQRRQREANKQTTEEKKPVEEKQTTSTDSGRREKRQEPKIPRVPCTLTLNQAPVTRGFSFGMTLAQIRERFRDTTVKVTAVDQPAGSNKFEQKHVLYSSGAVVPDATSGSLREWEKLHPDVAKTRQPRNQRQEEAAETLKNVEEIRLWFYGGNENPVLFSYIFIYDSNLIFNSSDEIKEIYLKNYKIPTDSWTPVDEDRTRNYDWECSCIGWQARFVTSPKNEGLRFAVINSDVAENLDALEKKAKKAKTTTFNP